MDDQIDLIISILERIQTDAENINDKYIEVSYMIDSLNDILFYTSNEDIEKMSKGELIFLVKKLKKKIWEAYNELP